MVSMKRVRVFHFYVKVRNEIYKPGSLLSYSSFRGKNIMDYLLSIGIIAPVIFEK
jgi:hypothetical protein